MRGLCTDPVLRRSGKKAARFIDNGWYVGHDEPSVNFVSNAAGWIQQAPHPDAVPGPVPGQTVRDFGKDAQYGAPDLSFYGGTLISKVQPNPQFAGKCR
jgi:hypothetical protein